MTENKELTIKEFLSLKYFFDPDNSDCSGLFSMISPENFVKEAINKRDCENKDVSSIMKKIPFVEAKFEEGIATINEVLVGVITDFDSYRI